MGFLSSFEGGEGWGVWGKRGLEHGMIEERKRGAQIELEAWFLRAWLVILEISIC